MANIVFTSLYRKTALLLAISVITVCSSYAQTNWQWATNLYVGGPIAVITDHPGNVYIAGSSFNTDTSGGGIIAKYNSSGSLEWVKGAGDTAVDCYANSIAVGPSGNVYIFGSFEKERQVFGIDTLYPVSGSNSMFITKYDSSGNVLWAKAVSGAGIESSALSITTDPMENIFVTGCFTGDTLVFGSTKLVNPGSLTFSSNANIFIAKYDSAGNILWARGAGCLGNEVSYSVVTDTKGNAYIAGSLDSVPFTLGTTTLSDSGRYNMFIAKYDGSGNVLWAQSSTGMCNMKALAIDAADNIYTTGLYGPGNVTFGSTTLTDPSATTRMYLTKYDTSGNITWAKTAAANAGATSMNINPNGYLYITGGFNCSASAFLGPLQLTATDGNELFIAKYDTSGGPLAAIMVGSNTNDTNAICYGNAITTDATGNVYVAGAFSDSSIYFGSIMVQNIFNVSYYRFLAKATEIAEAVKPLSTTTKNISVYPNPTAGIFDIVVPYGQYTCITIYNTLGVTIYKSALNSRETDKQVNLQNFPPGVYYISVSGYGDSQTLPFVISH